MLLHMYSVYIIESLSDGRLYIGQTSDLNDRLRRHNQNRSKSTKGRGPWRLIHHEEFESRSEAYAREQYLKSLKSRQYILKNIVVR